MTENNYTQNQPHKQNFSDRENSDEIDLLALFGTLWDGRRLIVVITLLFTALGVAYALLQTPIYRANSLIQVEEKQGGLPGMEDLSGLLGSSSSATTEIELIKSRRVLGKAVEDLNLDIVIRPQYFPIIGQVLARGFTGHQGELADPLLGERFAWGGERLTISRLKVPSPYEGNPLVLETTDQGWRMLSEGGRELLTGSVNQPAVENGFEVLVTQLVARPGTQFEVIKRRYFNAILDLQQSISATEKGRDTGIISLSFEHRNPQRAQDILDAIGNNYVRQNVERNSAEAAQSLEFLRAKLPEVKQELEEAERKLNAYQKNAESIDITAEAGALLDQVVELEKRISELEIQRAEIEQRFRPTHPRYKAWASQMAELKERRAELDGRIGVLPETQQELVRLRRDVEVGNEIYLQMLSNIQQLDIARAGTVGNVRVVDQAAVNVEEPVKPKKAFITILAFLLGGLTGIVIVLFRAFLNRGVENPDEIERLGLPVYAGIPLSHTQEEISPRERKRLRRSPKHGSKILALENPADLAIESLRSLRTSLHFGMIDAPNNILMISGPSPGVGKTFVSVNLAAVMALADQKVLLVDADMRKGFAHEIFGTTNEKGLSDLLSGRVAIDEALHQSEVEGLSFIPRGTVPPNPSELLMSKRFEDFLKGVMRDYDLVIVDTPPILAVTDAAIVGKHAGTTMLVTRFGLNPAKEIELTKRRFEQNGIEVKGAIFNAVVKKASAYSYGGYAYYSY